MINIINLTPHDVDIICGDRTVTIHKSGIVTRVESKSEKIFEIDGIDIFKTVFGKVTDLPDYKDNNFYIVSKIVQSASPERKDLLSPSQLIRNDKGEVVGCLGLELI